MVWTSIQKFIGMGINFISGIILARLLKPEDYGCIGMLSIFMVIAGALVDGGFASALIQKKRPTQEDYSTIFFFNLGMSLLMYLILFCCAPWIARFYKIPLLSSVLRVQGTILIINSCILIQGNQLRKQFCFKKLTIVSLMTSVISLLFGIIMAYNGYGVWSLVSMNLIGASLKAIIYWLTNKWFPLFVFSWTSFKELFNFGFFMFMTHFIHSVCNNIQGLLIGRLYNPAMLGYYSKAKSTEELASKSISDVMGQVTYPLYAEYQQDKKMLSNVIKRITNIVAYITFPIMFILILIAKPLFILLYSNKWLTSVPYFQILCLAGIAISLQSVNMQSIAAIGKSRIMFRWTIIKRIIGITIIISGLAVFGIKGLLVGMVFQSWLMYLINVYLVEKYIGYKFITQMKELASILALAILSFGVAYSISYVFYGLNMYILTICQFVIYIIIYLGCSYMLKIESYQYFVDNLPLIIGKIIKK